MPLLPRNLLLEVLKVLCLPRNLHFQCTKCRSCHETSATGGAQSAAPATKSAVPVHKVLPRNLVVEVAQGLRPPRNLQFQCTKCCCLPRNLLLEMLKVLRPPRNLHIQIHIAQRCQGGLQWQAQLFVRDILFLIQINFLFV